MWLGVLTVSVGIFSMITVEQLPVGLIPSIAAELGVSTGTAGKTVTAPGVIAAFASTLHHVRDVPLVALVDVGQAFDREMRAGLLVVALRASTR
jgi:hypothetical protein